MIFKWYSEFYNIIIKLVFWNSPDSILFHSPLLHCIVRLFMLFLLCFIFIRFILYYLFQLILIYYILHYFILFCFTHFVLFLTCNQQIFIACLTPAWNPCDLDKMALPPCHMFCQFYVADGELSCQVSEKRCNSSFYDISISHIIGIFLFLLTLFKWWSIFLDFSSSFLSGSSTLIFYFLHFLSLFISLSPSPCPPPTS